MTMLPRELDVDKDPAALRQATQILSQARAQCVALGIQAGDLGSLLLDEAMLAWLMAEWSERDVRQRLLEAMSQDVRHWYGRARVATGQCDCVQEVQLAGQLEAESMGLGLAGKGVSFPRGHDRDLEEG